MLQPLEQSAAFRVPRSRSCLLPDQPPNEPSGQTWGENADVPEYQSFLRLPGLGRGGLLSSHMTAEGARRGELTQSMTDHVFGNIDRHMPASVMDSDRVSNHLRKDHTGTTPCAQHFLFAFLVHCFNSLQKLGLNKWPFFQ